MSDQTTPTRAEQAAALPPLPPDDENPAIQFAKKSFYYSMGLIVAFIAAVVAFIL